MHLSCVFVAFCITHLENNCNVTAHGDRWQTGGRKENSAKAAPSGADAAPEALQVRRVAGQLLEALASSNVSSGATSPQHDGWTGRSGRGRSPLQASVGTRKLRQRVELVQDFVRLPPPPFALMRSGGAYRRTTGSVLKHEGPTGARQSVSTSVGNLTYPCSVPL